MRSFVRLVLALAFLLAVNCSSREHRLGKISSREYEIYSAVLDTITEQGVVGLRDSTKTDSVFLEPPDSIQWRLLRDFVRRNQHPALVDTNQLDVDASFRIVNYSLYRRYFTLVAKHQDARVVRDHPGSQGVLWLSRVGFSPNGDSALVDVQVIDFLHSPTERYLLTQNDGRWQVVLGRVPPG